MKFCLNVARLFATIVGLATFFAVALTVSAWYVQELCKPRYEPAAKAVYYYRPGHPQCDYMHGAVLHSKTHDKLPITFVEVPNTPENNTQIPCVFFYDKDGAEIVKSRMHTFWTLGDMNIRFGIRPIEFIVKEVN